MHHNVMPIDLFQYTPRFESTVDGFLSVPNPLLHEEGDLLISKTSWTLDIARRTTNESIVCLHALIGLEMAHKGVSEYIDIRPISTRKRTIDPHNIPSQDTKSYFITESRLLELVAIEGRMVVSNLEVSSINCTKTVIAFVLLESVLPDNLLR